jgi:hypothetical protein
MWVICNASRSNDFFSALAAAFFNRSSKNWEAYKRIVSERTTRQRHKANTFRGQPHCEVPKGLACAWRPAPPLRLRKGTASFIANTLVR